MKQNINPLMRLRRPKCGLAQRISQNKYLINNGLNSNEYLESIYQGTKNVTTTELFEHIATGVTSFHIDNGDVDITLTVDGVSIGTVASGEDKILSGSGTILGYVGSGTGTVNIGQSVLG